MLENVPGSESPRHGEIVLNNALTITSYLELSELPPKSGVSRLKNQDQQDLCLKMGFNYFLYL